MDPKSAIMEFLGVEPDEGGLYPDKEVMFTYRTKTMDYMLYLNISKGFLGASADPNHAYGGCSLCELSGEYTRINIETEPEFYGEQNILVCRKDYDNEKNVKTLMIMKWPNGELSLWQNLIQTNAISKQS